MEQFYHSPGEPHDRPADRIVFHGRWTYIFYLFDRRWHWVTDSPATKPSWFLISSLMDFWGEHDLKMPITLYEACRQIGWRAFLLYLDDRLGLHLMPKWFLKETPAPAGYVEPLKDFKARIEERLNE
jgi:hypothetical protein